MATVGWLLTLGLATVFAWSGLTKIARPERWTADVRRYRLPQSMKRIVVLVVPWIELTIAVALLAGRSRFGGTLAFLLLIAFSLAILRLHRILQTKAVPCGCLGGTSTRDYRLLLIRNGLLALGALLLVAVVPSDSGERYPVASRATVLLAAVLLIAAASAWAIFYAAHVYPRDMSASTTRNG
jgi:uncharacterized membrane protein YphA (DoxX/SURF4 family)